MKRPTSIEDLQMHKRHTERMMEGLMSFYEHLVEWEEDTLNKISGHQVCIKCGEPLEKERVKQDRWVCLKCRKLKVK